MDHTAPQGLIEHISKLEDPRVDRNKKHELIDVVVPCVCAVLSGAEGWRDIEGFGRTKLDWLRRHVPLANGIPVDDTIARIISALSVKGFAFLMCGGSTRLADSSVARNARFNPPPTSQAAARVPDEARLMHGTCGPARRRRTRRRAAADRRRCW